MPVEVGDVNPRLREDTLRDTCLEEVAGRRHHRKSDDLVVQAVEDGRAGEKQVFGRGCLKGAIVRCAHDEASGRPRPRHAEPWTPGSLVDKQTVAIPPKAGVDGPLAKTDAILDEER